MATLVSALRGIEPPRYMEPGATGIAIKTKDISVPYTAICRSFVVVSAQDVTGDEGYIEAFVPQELFARAEVETSSCLVYPIG